VKAKTFRGTNLKHALYLVKQEMGEDAVILSTQEVRGRLGILSRPMIEVVATLGQPDTVSTRMKNTTSMATSVYAQSVKMTDQKASQKTDARAFSEERVKPLEREIRRLKDQILSMSHEHDQVEIQEKIRQSNAVKTPAQTLAVRFKLIGIEEKIAEDLAKQVIQMGGDYAQALYKILEKRIRIAEPVGASGAHVIIFVGPTGAGKTTTIAKLAARCALEESKDVALVTLDTFRIGAIDQLQRYAQLIGIPLQVVASREGFEQALRAFSRQELIFVDTAGRSPKETNQFLEYAQLLKQQERQVEMHLTLPATMSLSNLRATIEHFKKYGVDRICVTKIDEIVDYSAILSLTLMSDAPVSYCTFGQKVPEDIEIASKNKLAKMFVDWAFGSQARQSVQDKNIETWFKEEGQYL